MLDATCVVARAEASPHAPSGLAFDGRSPATRFAENAGARRQGIPEAYATLAQNVFAQWARSAGLVTEAADVAQAVWRAATDPHCPMRLPAGADGQAMAAHSA